MQVVSVCADRAVRAVRAEHPPRGVVVHIQSYGNLRFLVLFPAVAFGIGFGGRLWLLILDLCLAVDFGSSFGFDFELDFGA